MRRFLLATSITLALATPATADNLVAKRSAHGVADTMNRLEAAVKEQGIAVLARVNHAAAAQKVDMTLRPTELLIFGNPKLGTPLMQSQQRAGLDLPLKALVWQDEQGQTWIAYRAPAALAAEHGIRDRDPIVQKMTSVLEELTTRAASR
jgi:uncharacterized protein (DUF302 family)